jgi:hypothetical protein
VNVHDIQLSDLPMGSEYVIRAFGATQDGRMIDGGAPVKAATAKDHQPPVISGLKIENTLLPGKTQKAQAVVRWRTDEEADSRVCYEEGLGKPDDSLQKNCVEDDSLTQSHTLVLTGLKTGGVYRIQVASKDIAGNRAVFPVRSIVIPESSESVADIIFKNFEDTFRFLRQTP